MNHILTVLRTETLEKDLSHLGSSTDTISKITGNGQLWILLYAAICLLAGWGIRSSSQPMWAMLLSSGIVALGAIRFTTNVIRVVDLHQVVTELERRRASDARISAPNGSGAWRKAAC